MCSESSKGIGIRHKTVQGIPVNFTIYQVSQFLTSEDSPIVRYSVSGHDADSFIETLLVIANNRTKIELEDIPPVFTPVKGKRGIRGKCTLAM